MFIFFFFFFSSRRRHTRFDCDWSSDVCSSDLLEVRPHHTPGHSPGGVCLEVGAAGKRGQDLFVGDTLFAGAIGRTALPGGNYGTLIASIRNVLFPFGDDARVYPGHGSPTTIGEERRVNPFLADDV